MAGTVTEIEIDKTYSFTAPDGADNWSYDLTWEGGTENQVDHGDLNMDGTIDFKTSSGGIVTIRWFDNLTLVGMDIYSAISKYLDFDTFNNNHPQFDSESTFIENERIVRGKINTFCRQSFVPYNNMTMTISGHGGNNLYMPIKLNAINGITDRYGADISEDIALAPDTNGDFLYSVRNSLVPFDDIKHDVSYYSPDYFKSDRYYTVTGDWGWSYVPPEVSLASEILILDKYTGVGELTNYPVGSAQLGDFSFRLKADGSTTTGNADADLILSNHILLYMELI